MAGGGVHKACASICRDVITPNNHRALSLCQRVAVCAAVQHCALEAGQHLQRHAKLLLQGARGRCPGWAARRVQGLMHRGLMCARTWCERGWEARQRQALSCVQEQRRACPSKKTVPAQWAESAPQAEAQRLLRAPLGKGAETAAQIRVQLLS